MPVQQQPISSLSSLQQQQPIPYYEMTNTELKHAIHNDNVTIEEPHYNGNSNDVYLASSTDPAAISNSHESGCLQSLLAALMCLCCVKICCC